MRFTFVLAISLCILDIAVSDSGYAKGKQFLAAFMFNYGSGETNQTANYLFISSEKPGTVHVELAKIGHIPGWKHSQKLSPGGTVMVALPDQSEMPGHSALQKRGVHVYADVDISVYAMNDDVSITSADASIVLPVTALSTSYTIPSPKENAVILIAGLIPGTDVTLNLKSSCRVTYKGSQLGNSTIRETLGNQDVLELVPSLTTTKTSTCDMSGSTVTATHPVAVFTGSACVYRKNAGCDHEVEQVMPNDVLGFRFIVPDLKDTSTYRVKVVAAFDSTHLFINEHHRDSTIHSYQADLDKGGVVEYIIPDGTFLEVFSSHGVHVTQYDDTVAPFSIPIPAVENYGWNYTVSTMNNPTSSSFINYMNLVVHRDSADTVKIDGVGVDRSKWRRVRDLGYSVATISVTVGSHHIEADDRFMVQVYGYDGVASYAYEAGYFFTKLPSAHLGPTDYPPLGSTSPTNTITSQRPCADGQGVNCQVLDSTIGICSGPSAQQLCRKHCGLCQTCTSPGSCIVG